MRIFFTLLLTVITFCTARAQYRMGMDFSDNTYNAVPKKATLTRSLTTFPAAASLKKHTPIPGNQSHYGTCTAWAVAYTARTTVESIKNNWTDKDHITAKAYSPAFLFRQLKPHDNDCDGGSVIDDALQLLKTQGAVAFDLVNDLCLPSLDQQLLTIAENEKIKDYMRLFDPYVSPAIKIQAVKKAIHERKPVVFGMNCPPSFMQAKEVWISNDDPNINYGGHAMCVIGYDDNKYGGAFEIQNSWSTNWGNGGYTWIRYQDFANFTRYAYEIIDLPVAKKGTIDLAGTIELKMENGQNMPIEKKMLSRGLEIVPVIKNNGPFTTYTSKQSYPSGTKFRIAIQNNQPAYVYAISTDMTQKITKIFPFEDGISAALTDSINNILIPDENYFIAFDQQPGTDLLCVLYSKDEIDYNNLVEKIHLEQGTFSERLLKVLGDKLVSPKDINFENSTISFVSNSLGKTVVPLIVELKHH